MKNAKNRPEYKELNLDDSIEGINKIKEQAAEVVNQESKHIIKKFFSGDFEILSENLLKKIQIKFKK